MRRRAFIAGLAGVTALGAGCTDPRDDPATTDAGTDPDPDRDQPLPADIMAVEPLARAVDDAVADHVEAPRVFIRPAGELVLTYQTTTETADALGTELHQLASLYADVVADGDYTAVTLTIVTDAVQAIVPEPSVAAYAAGDLEQEALLETIAVTAAPQQSDAE